MPELNVLLAALICGGIGASVLLLVVAVRGTVLDPTRPPNRLEALLAASAVAAADAAPRRGRAAGDTDLRRDPVACCRSRARRVWWRSGRL